MGFVDLRSMLQPLEEERIYQTIPDAVLYLLSVKGLSLSDLANRAEMPLCTIVNLPNRSVSLSFEEADKIAEALDAGMGDFTFASSKLPIDDKVSFALLDNLTYRLCRENPAEEPMKAYFG